MNGVLRGRISEILWRDWDPLGVNDVPEARTEYASYVDRVSRLLEEGASEAEIEARLRAIEVAEMGTLGSDETRWKAVRELCRLMRDRGGSLGNNAAVKRIDHVGVAVADLAAARTIWDALLGEKAELEDVPSQKVTTASYPCGIELIAPAAGDSPIAGFLAKRGGGIHHVTLEVGDLEAHLARLKAQGVRLINETPVPGAGGCRVAFLHPAAAGGVLVELKEKAHG